MPIPADTQRQARNDQKADRLVAIKREDPPKRVLHPPAEASGGMWTSYTPDPRRPDLRCVTTASELGDFAAAASGRDGGRGRRGTPAPANGSPPIRAISAARRTRNASSLFIRALCKDGLMKPNAPRFKLRRAAMQLMHQGSDGRDSR